jgi:cellulose synthase (UDP-forming)
MLALKWQQNGDSSKHIPQFAHFVFERSMNKQSYKFAKTRMRFKSSITTLTNYQWTKYLLFLAFLAGIGLYINYVAWWFYSNQISNPLFLIPFGIAALYSAVHLVGNWFLLFFSRNPESPKFLSPEKSSYHVDIFLVANDELIETIQASIRSALNVNSHQEIWLLDLEDIPERKQLAEQLGVRYLAKNERRKTQAALINSALSQSSGNILGLFDANIVLNSKILDKTLPFFADPKIGFVQFNIQANEDYSNWVAKTAYSVERELFETNDSLPDTASASILNSSHTLVRRKALNAIGGFIPDQTRGTATSLALHTNGWKSYAISATLGSRILPKVPSILVQQQVEWTKGSIQLFISVFPRLVFRLRPIQQLSYLIRMTRYWIGPIITLHILISAYLIGFQSETHHTALQSYTLRITGLVLWDLVIRWIARRYWARNEKYSLIYSLLAYSSWPIGTWALFTSVFQDGKFIPKQLEILRWFFPNMLAFLLLITTMILVALDGETILFVLFLFGTMQILFQSLLLWKWQTEPGSSPQAV